MNELNNEQRPLAKMDRNYYAVHAWLSKNYGKATSCSNDPKHKAKRFDWANIDGIYERDIKHFKQLCHSCHSKFDMRKSTRAKMRSTHLLVPRTWVMKRVAKYTLDGEFVTEYESVKQAAEDNNCTSASITFALKGQSKQSRGYLWRYI